MSTWWENKPQFEENFLHLLMRLLVRILSLTISLIVSYADYRHFSAYSFNLANFSVFSEIKTAYSFN